ncbi:MAG: type II toxin-antitoxin system PemK/MazF family toxin [Bdellovibrionota bacterium]
MRQWDIYCVNQPESRHSTQPKQPGDPSDKNRYYIIISNDYHLAYGGNPTVIPIGTRCINRVMHLKVPKAKESGLHHDSYAWCNEIYTVPKKFLIKKIGLVPAENIENIKNALQAYLNF